MEKFDWLETFELGLPAIDNDHREMLAIMKSVDAAAESEHFELCVSLLDKLVDFSIAHFKREEDLLRNAGYTHVDTHKEYHSGLVARVKTVKDICVRIKSKKNLQEYCREMFGFLVDDVVVGDLNFKSFLEESGLVKQRSRI